MGRTICDQPVLDDPAVKEFEVLLRSKGYHYALVIQNPATGLGVIADHTNHAAGWQETRARLQRAADAVAEYGPLIQGNTGDIQPPGV